MKFYLKRFSSMRVTIGCLLATALLLLVMSVSQIEYGPRGAVDKFIHSLFVYWEPEGLDLLIPYLPGGYLIAATLTANLVGAIYFTFKFEAKAIGLCLIYLAIILLVTGDFLSYGKRDSSLMEISEARRVNFSESTQEFELSIKDISDPKTELVVAIPEKMLVRQQTIRHPQLPFFVSINEYMPNSIVEEHSPTSNAKTLLVNKGIGKGLTTIATPMASHSDTINRPSASITLFNSEKAIGSWLVRHGWEEQLLNYQGKLYSLQLRPKRYYYSFEFELNSQTIPSAGSTNRSRDAALTLHNNQESRQVVLSPGHPFSYKGLSFHLKKQNENSIQVSTIRNPGKSIPYIGLFIGIAGLALYASSNLRIGKSKRIVS